MIKQYFFHAKIFKEFFNGPSYSARWDAHQRLMFAQENLIVCCLQIQIKKNAFIEIRNSSIAMNDIIYLKLKKRKFKRW